MLPLLGGYWGVITEIQSKTVSIRWSATDKPALGVYTCLYKRLEAPKQGVHGALISMQGARELMVSPKEYPWVQPPAEEQHAGRIQPVRINVASLFRVLPRQSRQMRGRQGSDSTSRGAGVGVPIRMHIVVFLAERRGPHVCNTRVFHLDYSCVRRASGPGHTQRPHGGRCTCRFHLSLGTAQRMQSWCRHAIATDTRNDEGRAMPMQRNVGM